MTARPPPASVPSPSLGKLLEQDPVGWSLASLWTRLPVALRIEAVEAVLEDPDPEVQPLQDALLRALGKAGGFRRQMLSRKKPTEVASLLGGRLTHRALPQPEAVLRTFFVRRRAEMLGAYLDGVGVPHEDGLLDDDFEAGSVDPEAAAATVDRLLRDHPVDDVCAYLVTLHLLSPDLVPGIAERLRLRFAPEREESGGGAGVPPEAMDTGGPEPAPVQPSPLPESEEPPGPDDATHQIPSMDDAPDPEWLREARGDPGTRHAPLAEDFTALDRTLVHAARNARQEVAGAPDRFTVDDMVDELIGLNAARPASYFHRGFLDALYRDPWRDDLRAEEPAKRAWYAAGWLSGLAETGDDEAVLEAFDRGRASEGILAESPSAGDMARPILFDALCRAGREPEAASLLSAEVVLRVPELLKRLLDEGTRLLRESAPERARPLFDRLGEAVRGLEARGEPTTEPFFLEVRRRRAHCHRQLGEVESARRLLERLLQEDPDPGSRAMILADVGLLDAGYRVLADVRLWRSPSERRDLMRQLEKGQDRFQAAANLRTPRSAHGAWPLGVLALAKDDAAMATNLLSRALSGLLERPSRYREQNLLPRLRLATGIAMALSLDYAQMRPATDHLRKALSEGARIPDDLLASVLEALDTHEEDLLTPVIERILETGGDGALDALLRSDTAARKLLVARALLERGKDERVQGGLRVAALRQALQTFLREGIPSRDEAADALDRLEALAHSGVEADRFLELLAQPEALDPVWSAEEVSWSRISILQRKGDGLTAIAELRTRLNAVLQEHRWTAETEAEAIVQLARSLGLEPDWTRDLSARLESWKAEYGDEEAALPTAGEPSPSDARPAAKILIVGGDERQHALGVRVQELLERDGAPIRIHHLPTGWSGHWSQTLDQALKEARRHDAVVLLTFMRTEFGRKLRAGLGDTPWVSCPGVGHRQVAQMAKKAARFAGR